MTIFGIVLPEWLNWANIGAPALTILAFITALVKLKSSSNQIGVKITGLATVFTDLAVSLKSIVTLVDTVNAVSEQNKTLIEKLNQTFTEQREYNKNVAKFISECFQESNLSDEKKLKLKILLDELFYGNNIAIIDELKNAKAETDEQLVKANSTISKISEDLIKTKEKLEKVQATTKKSRRIR